MREQLIGAANPAWTGGTRRRHDGYVTMRTRGHPRADKNGNVCEHILVVEKAMQRELPSTAQVHHVNENRAENANSNLVACHDGAYHKLLHIRQSALDACGHASWRKCPYCQRYDDTARMIIHAAGKVTPMYCHRDCRIARQRDRQIANREPGVSTGIEWTDETWNPIRGCSRVSEGCRNCYAEVVAARFSGKGQAYEGLARRTANGKARWTGKIMFVEKHLHDPLHWREPRRVFVNSMSDLFHERVTDEQLDRIFAVMMLASRHTFQILTKRPERMRDYIFSKLPDHRDRSTAMLSKALSDTALANGLSWPLCPPWPPRNVMLGVSAEDQPTADERIPVLMATPAAFRFVSHEPLLGPIELRWPVDWVIVGGESGQNARPCDVQWIRNIVRQCRLGGIPPFVKQLGAEPAFRLADEERRGNMMPSYHHTDGDLFIKKLDDPKGGDPAQWPEELRIREFPRVEALV